MTLATKHSVPDRHRFPCFACILLLGQRCNARQESINAVTCPPGIVRLCQNPRFHALSPALKTRCFTPCKPRSDAVPESILLGQGGSVGWNEALLRRSYG